LRKIVAHVTDRHGGHKLGLMNPATLLYAQDDKGNLVPWRPELTPVQKYLWDIHETHILRTIYLADGRQIFFIDGGDMAQGIKYPQELVSTASADQIIIAAYNMYPWLEFPNVNPVRLVSGTEAHEMGESSVTHLVAAQLSAKYEGRDIQVVHHGLMDVDGLDIDYSHHGPPPGRRIWLHGNEGRYYLRDIMMRHIMAGQKPPDIVLRGHYHTAVIEELRIGEYKSHLVVTPSYCWLGAHGRQATRSAPEIINGMSAIEIENGKLVDIYQFVERRDLRTKEKL
jgi:hypothetical protein